METRIWSLRSYCVKYKNDHLWKYQNCTKRGKVIRYNLIFVQTIFRVDLQVEHYVLV